MTGFACEDCGVTFMHEYELDAHGCLVGQCATCQQYGQPFSIGDNDYCGRCGHQWTKT